MTISTAALEAELLTLRKGKGVAARDLSDRIGPALRRACGIDNTDSPQDVRRKLTTRLENASRTLSVTHREAVLAALAIAPDARQELYVERIRFVASRMERDQRTARRRIDQAIQGLADVLSRVSPTGTHEITNPGPQWHTEEVRMWLRLRQSGTEILEYRRIVADSDMGELPLSISVPYKDEKYASIKDVTVDLFHGGTLRGTRVESSTRVSIFLVLPKSLSEGQTHEYLIRYRLDTDRHMPPHLAHTPRSRCDRFDLSIRFEANPPKELERLSGVLHHEFDDPVVASEPVLLDGAGEVRCVWNQLEPGVAYGFRWKY